MRTEETEAAAATILEARRAGDRLTGLPAPLLPGTIDEGFAIQDAIISRSGERVAGWKIACTAAPVQQLFGVDEPFFGAIFESVVFESPARVEADRFRLRCIESEIAFRMGADLAPRPTAFSRDEVLDAVDVVLPAFELIEPRFDSLLTDAAALAFADCALNGGLVRGAPISDWRALDLAEIPIALRVDGALEAEGRGADALGHPAVALEWLANALSKRGVTLRAGQVVSTGTCTGITYIEPGQVAVADFGPLGHVEVGFV